MPHARIANYKSQREHLQLLAAGKADFKALFLVGAADHGKTCLLRWFEAEFESSASIVLFDLGDPSQTCTPRLVMTTCMHQLGSKHFSEYNQEDVNLNAKYEARIQGVTINGSYNTLTAVAGPTEEDKLSIAISLTASFIEGMKKAAIEHSAIVLCFDGYSPNTTLHRWFDIAFIKSVCELENVHLVVTGREIVEEGIPRRAAKRKLFRLTGVSDADEWIGLAATLGKQLPGVDLVAARERLCGIIDFTKGEPGAIMRWMLSLPSAAS